MGDWRGGKEQQKERGWMKGRKEDKRGDKMGWKSE